MIRVLHITDWHISNPNGQEEKLREGFFRDYINGLYNNLLTNSKTKIDLIVCSGDFINIGIEANFKHATKVLEYLATKFSVPKENVITVIGNHDVAVRGFQVADNSSYKEFSEQFGRLTEIITKPLYSLQKFRDDIYILTLDSIYNEEGKINNEITNERVIKPSEVKGETIDEIVTAIETLLPQNICLIVVSHFPMVLNHRMTQMIVEEKGWVEKHLWKSGFELAGRIALNRIDDTLIFLYGDGHLDNYWAYTDKHHFFMTGMFGGNYLKRTYEDKLTGETISFNKTNDVKIIEYSNNKEQIEIFTVSYYPLGHKFSSQTGEWKIEKGEVVIETKPTINYPSHNTIIPLEQDNLVDLISSPIEQQIIEDIERKNLYFFARTATSNKESSLGWVSISNLFENKELFSHSIDKQFDWLVDKGIVSQESKTIFIGLGFWGSIFAAHLNVKADKICFSVSSHRIRSNHTYFESIDFVINSLSNQEVGEVVIITDVISTGNSILELKHQLSSKLPLQKTRFFAISIISDKTQPRIAQITEFKKIGSLCTNLPIPVIDNETLPNERIFPVSYDFR
jgi:hypothetical protein